MLQTNIILEPYFYISPWNALESYEVPEERLVEFTVDLWEESDRDMDYKPYDIQTALECLDYMGYWFRRGFGDVIDSKI